jgi:hypothetical protein
VVGGGRRARGVKGGEGRDVSPVPPTMAMEMGSKDCQRIWTEREGRSTVVGCWEGGHGGVAGWDEGLREDGERRKIFNLDLAGLNMA